jgi:hypothetical protein
MQTFTARIFITLFLALVTQLALAQFQDQFSDGDFTNNPEWSGDILWFMLEGNALKLNAPKEDGAAYLSTPYTLSRNATWEWKVKMDFNPSGSNFARVYLCADLPNLTEPLNGYFVTVGDSQDDVSLYKQEGATQTKIIDGRDDVLNLSSVDLGIRVTHTEHEGWKLFTSAEATDEYVLEGTYTDQPFTEGKHFGIFCKYTSTRSDKFLFDDFKVQQLTTTDDILPLLLNVEISSASELKLTFSESLEQTTSTKVENYLVSHSVGHPITATLETDPKTVLLSFENNFPENTTLALSVSGVTDLAGNEIQATSRDLIYTLPVTGNFKDIIITEIFADPAPSIGLPEVEFIEIFNRSQRDYNLSGWQLTDQSSSAVLPNVMLPINGYLVLTPENVDPSTFENALPLIKFPTLNNANDVLILKDERGMTIDSVSYFSSWYKDDDKSEGGWSLEIIDPQNVCSEHQNWIASVDQSGGTPGRQNSVFANKPDQRGPKMLSAIPVNSTSIQLQFDEKLAKQLPLTSDFEATPTLAINQVAFTDASLTGIQLFLEQPIQNAVTYSIQAKEIFDCVGNVIQKDFSNVEFGLPEEVDSLDVLINEILFNPRPTGVDFVEVVNNSSKFINLKNWSLANFEDGSLKDKTRVTSKDVLLKPGGILSLTEDANILKGEYLLSNEKNFLQIGKLPNFNDDEGSVALVDSNDVVIDYLIYTKEMHSIFLKDEEGVSLERISYEHPNSVQNWKSASSSSGFATPGYINSNSLHDPQISSEAIQIEPEIFNPLGDLPNFAVITYNFEQGGYIANVKVYDAQGHLIKDIANNDILGTTGFYRWDGDRNDGTKANIGYYMVWFEIFNEQGTVMNFQKRVAVASVF